MRRRLGSGAPIRAAMREAGMNIPRLASAIGVSPQLVGFVAGAGKSAREECSDRTAGLIAEALGKPVGDLFDTEPSFDVALRSTSTPRMQMQTSAGTPLPERLMTQAELATYLRKSKSWIDGEITKARKQGQRWPGLIYVGHERRFDRQAVLAHVDREPQVA
jgi:hypothetical protein